MVVVDDEGEAEKEWWMGGVSGGGEKLKLGFELGEIGIGGRRQWWGGGGGSGVNWVERKKVR